MFVITSPSSLSEFLVELQEKQGAHNIKIGAIHVPGMHLRFEYLQNALKYCGWNGEFLSFSTLCECWKELKAYQDTKGAVTQDENWKPSEHFLTTYRASSEQFLLGFERKVVILCTKCTFWAEWDEQETEEKSYVDRCPACKNEGLVVVERTLFEYGNQNIWEEVEGWKGELDIHSVEKEKKEPIIQSKEDTEGTEDG